MARNRKRAKERRVRQAQPVVSGRSREPLDEAREIEERSQSMSDLELVSDGDGDATDGSSVGELPGAKLTNERPEPAGDGAPDPLEQAAPDADVAELALATASRLEEAEPAGGSRAQSAAVRAPQTAVAVPRRWLGARLLAFLEGSWRELQRVQWPDRRQVMQATGVVIGFVIVASVFLGVADYFAGKIVHFVLNGTF